MTELQPQETINLEQTTPALTSVPESDTPAQTPTVDATEGPKEPKSSPRDLQMRAIAEARMRKIAEEVAYGDTLADEAHDVATGVELGTTEAAREAAASAKPTTDEALHTEPRQPVEPSTVGQQQQPIPTTVQPATPQRRLRTINGQQFAFTDDEWDQLAQHGAIAVAQAQRQAQQQLPQPQQQQAAPTPAPQPRPSFDDAAALEFVNRLSYGAPTEAVAATRAFYDRAVEDAVARIQGHQPQYQPEHVAAYATQQAIAQMRLEQNLLTIGNEYPDIFTNTRLSQLAALTLHDIRARDGLLNRQRSDLELYREACNEVRAAIGYQPPQSTQQPQSAPQPATQAAASPAATSATRVTRKREAPQQPRSVNQSAPIDSTEKRYPTPSEIVAGYRKARGQMSMH